MFRDILLLAILMVALYCAREPQVFLLGLKDTSDGRPLTFAEIEQITWLERMAADLQEEKEASPVPAWLKPLYQPWKPDWE